MRRIIVLVAALILVSAVGLLTLASPVVVSEDDLEGLVPDLARGETVFWAGGCAACHAADGAEGDAKLVLSGGHKLVTPFGTFVAPNISQDKEHGIGAWSAAEIVSAVMNGSSPDGRHYYPAFPYPSYAKAEVSDIVSLAAFLRTLPSDPTPSQPHDLSFPYNVRWGIGLWKFLDVKGDWVLPVDDPVLERGRYLVEAIAHCGECHTPRNLLGGLALDRWLAGAPNPSGKGRIPNITPAKLTWSASEIAEYLNSGFTPEFDTVGGAMTAVVAGTQKLSVEDRAAIAAYVKAVPAAE